MGSAALVRLRQRGVIAALDAQVAARLAELAPESHEAVLLAVALASRNTREGHVCLDLDGIAGSELRDAEGELTGVRCPVLSRWRELLSSTSLVGDGSVPTPLVLDARARLYLHRYWQHERRVAEELVTRARPCEARLDAAALRDAVARLFGEHDPSAPDWQRVAAELAVLRGLTVIVGGPGTGKTSTVARLLSLLSENSVALGERPLRSLLLAPTGKAAARLAGSIQAAMQGLDCSAAARAAIGQEASTIHRALGSVAGSRTRFRHGSLQRLPADVVVVDEASMVDIALMRRLLEAVPPQSRLILLGDRNQLASVEAGAVLGDISAGFLEPRYSRALRTRASEVFGETLPGLASYGPAPSPLLDSIVELRKSRRFRNDGGIGALARALELGDADRALACLGPAGASEVRLVESGAAIRGDRRLIDVVIEGYRPYLSQREALRALDAYDGFRVLCAHRKGRAGVETLNAAIERALAARALIGTGSRFYAGRPIIVTENDHQLGLFNGDIGLVLVDPALGARVQFRAAGGVRSIAPARLPAHETAYALSVHKSQGSEFDEVLLVLPDASSPLLSRELVYTGVTRARRRLTIFGSSAALRAAVGRRIDRASGLRDALWNDT